MKKFAKICEGNPLYVKDLEKASLVTILITVILVLSVVNTVCGNGVIATVTVGSEPVSVAYDSAKDEIFVVNSNSNTNFMAPGSVSVISDANNSVMATIPVGAAPSSVVYDSAKGKLFVANGYTGNSNNVNNNSNAVSIISDNTNTVVATVPIGFCSGALAYDSGKSEIFVASVGYGSGGIVSVISDSSNTIVATVFSVGSSISGAAYDSGKGEIFLADTYGSTTTTVLDGKPRTSNSIFIVSDSTNSVVATVPVGFRPFGIAYDSGKEEIFVANYGENTISVISDRTNGVVATIPVGMAPRGIAYDSVRGEIFVTNSGSNSISVISDRTNAVVATIDLGTEKTAPTSLAYDSGKDVLFVANGFSSSSNDIYFVADNLLVLSASSFSSIVSASPNPTVPEFSSIGLILAVVVTCAVALALRKSARIRSGSKR